MIDLTRKSLPNTIEVYGRAFSVYTDFRVWLRFEIELAEHRSKEPLNIDYIFKNDRPVYCPIRDILQFARPKNELPRSVRGTSDARIIDFRVDSDLIYAAFLQQYGIDLIDVPELHWHKFLALFRGLKGTKLDEVMGYRCYEKQTNKNIDPYEEMRDAWALETILTPEEEEELEAFNRMAEGGDSKG